jgi:hypothetical protein
MAAAKKAEPSGKPPPDVAAILELLNEIKRELSADATETPPPVALAYVEPVPVQKPITPVPPAVVPPLQAAAPEPPRIEPVKPEAAKPVPPKPAPESAAVPGTRPFLAPPALLPDSGPAAPAAVPPAAKTRPRIGMGITLAIVYVVIFAAAGLVISRWMHSKGVQVAEQAVPASGPAAAGDGNDIAALPGPTAPDAQPVAPPAPAPSETAQAPVVTAPAPPPPATPPREAVKTPEPVTPPVAASPAIEAPVVAAAVPAKPSPQPAAQTAPPPAAVTPSPPVMAAPTVAAPAANIAVATLTPPGSGAANRTAPSAPDAADTEALRTQGDNSLRQGDVSTARLFYQRAAEAGDGEAALLLGHTYNPAFLAQLGVRGLRGDLAQATIWYRRAADLGDKDADIALRSLPTH